MLSKPLTIAIFAAHVPPCPGGIAKFMGITAIALAKQGCKIVIVTSDFDNPDFSHKNITLVKLPIHERLPGKDRYPVIKRNEQYKLLLSKLSSLGISRVIALTRFHSTSHVAQHFARKNNIPFYLLECGANPLTVNNRVLDVGLRLVEAVLTYKIRKGVYKWGAMSQAGVEFLKDRYSIEGEFIWPCSIDTPKSVKKNTSDDKVVITYSGRIENLKGEEEIAQSFSNLVKKYPTIELNFLGDGSFLSVLKKRYTNKNIKYWGNVTSDIVERVNLNSDIFVCATRFPDGAVPNSVLEAGAAQCAGITSPNGGFTDLMRDGQNGLLTKPDLSDMQECIERLIVDKVLRRQLAEALAADIKKKYKPSSVAKKILKDLQIG